MGCPGIVPDEDGELVEGWVLSADKLTDFWPTLDAFEGEGYERVHVTVTIIGIQDVDAFVYQLNLDMT